MARAPKNEPESTIEENAGKHEEETSAAIEQLEILAQDLAFDEDTLISHLRDAMIEIFKHRPKPWSQLSNAEQRDVAKALEYAARAMVAKAVVVIASAGQPSIRAKFEGYSDKAGDLKGTLKFLEVTDEKVLSLHRASGKSVLLITADPNDFDKQQDPKLDEDEPALEFSDGPVDHPEDDSDLADEQEELEA